MCTVQCAPPIVRPLSVFTRNRSVSSLSAADTWCDLRHHLESPIFTGGTIQNVVGTPSGNPSEACMELSDVESCSGIFFCLIWCVCVCGGGGGGLCSQHICRLKLKPHSVYSRIYKWHTGQYCLVGFTGPISCSGFRASLGYLIWKDKRKKW